MPLASIQSPSARQLTKWRKLLQKKYRLKTGLFLAEGERCVRQIVENRHLSVVSVLFTGPEPPVPIPAGTSLYQLEEREFESITGTKTPQGIAAVCRIPEEVPLEAMTKRQGILLATDAVQDPGNLGTMIRTASWFGAVGFLCGTGTADPWNPKVVRSTAGATGQLPLLGGNLNEILRHLERSGWSVYLLDGGGGALPLQGMEAASRTVLVVGNEANGISPELFQGRKRVRIEGSPDAVESLNAAVALGIALYQAVVRG